MMTRLPFNHIKIIKESSFVKNTSILTIGIIIAQIIPIIAYPILSRLYDPKDFGILSTLTSFTAIISIFGSLKYESSILITKDSKLAGELIILIQIISLTILGIVEIFILFFSDSISTLLNANEINDWLWICPICAYCIIIFDCYNEWCVKHSLFKSLSLNKIINGGALPVGKICFSFTKSTGLILGELLGHFITAYSCVYRAVKKDWIFFKSPSLLHMKYLFKRYSDCPKFILPARLLNKVGQEIPVFCIMSFFSAEELGYFSMASTLLVLPTRVVGKAITDTFRQKANEIFQSKRSCRKFYIEVFSILFFISLISFTIIYFIAPDLFKYVLGEKWITAGYYCRIICFGSAISLITDFGAALYYIKERMSLLLIWQIIYFILTTSSLLIGIYYFKEITYTIACLVIGRSIAYIINGIMTFTLANAK